MACRRGNTHIVRCLLTEGHCNPNYKDSNGESPLAVTQNGDIIRILLQHGAESEAVYTSIRKSLGRVYSGNPLKSPVKIMVIGHSGEGKSTLIEALQKEPNLLSSLKSVFIAPKEVDRVSQLTAGIQPLYYYSGLYGDVLFHDLLG